MKNSGYLVVFSAVLLSLSLLSPLILWAFSDRQPAEVILERPYDLDGLVKMNVDIDKVIGRVATVYVNPEEFDDIKGRGLEIRWIPNRAKMYADSLWQATKGTANPMAAYHTYSELVADLDSIASAHPSICRLDSIGATVQGRGLWFMKISDNVNLEENEPEFKYISTMHGDEVVGMEMCYYLIEYLVNNYGSDSLATFLVDETEIWIMPLMNPDGNVAHTRYNHNGVDLNRDFPDFIADPNNTPAGREPETQAIMNWQFDHYSIQSANFHGGALVVNYPWDCTYDYNPDDTLFHHISLTYSITNLPMWNSSTFENGVVRGSEWYIVYGGMQDWNYYWMGCNEVTIELGENKWPPASTLPDYWDDNRESMLNYMARVHDGVRGLVTDASTSLPVAATVEIQGIDHEVYADPDVGDYHRMLLPGTYTVNFSATGYSPKSVSSVVVVADSATVLNVQLYPLVLGNVSGSVTEAGSGDPLGATVEVLGSGFGPVVSDSVTGHYSINVYQGVYTMKVNKNGYSTILRDSVVVSGSIVENFLLTPVAEHLYTKVDSLTIPDPGTIYSILTVPDSFTVEDLNVYVDISHTYIGDLVVELENPQGVGIILHHRQGGSSNDIKTWYDTQTQPYENLSALMGKSSRGDWTLWVHDEAGWDKGTLNLWKLQLYGGGGDYSPPSAVDDLTSNLAVDVLVLVWSAATDDVGVSHYVVYRNSDSGFEPQASDSIGWTASTSFVDENSPVGNGGVNGYYLVKAVDLSGNKSASSNRVGEFDKDLDGGSERGRKKFEWTQERG